MISQGVLSHEFRSVSQRQAQHIWFQNSSPNHTSVAQDMLPRLNEAEVNIYWNFKFPPVSSYHHTSSLQAWVFLVSRLLLVFSPYSPMLTYKTSLTVQIDMCSYLYTLTTCVHMCVLKCLHKQVNKYVWNLRWEFVGSICRIINYVLFLNLKCLLMCSSYYHIKDEKQFQFQLPVHSQFI